MPEWEASRFFDTGREAAEFAERTKEELYIAWGFRTWKSWALGKPESGLDYFNSMTAKAEDPKDIERLKKRVRRLKGSPEKSTDRIDEIKLVERTWESGQTSEGGIETEYWAIPHYSDRKTMSIGDFLLSGTRTQNILSHLHTTEGLPRVEITGEELSREGLGIITVPYSPIGIGGAPYVRLADKVICFTQARYEGYPDFDAEYMFFPKSELIGFVEDYLWSDSKETSRDVKGKRVVHSRKYPDKDNGWANPQVSEVNLGLSLRADREGIHLAMKDKG